MTLVQESPVKGKRIFIPGCHTTECPLVLEHYDDNGEDLFFVRWKNGKETLVSANPTEDDD